MTTYYVSAYDGSDTYSGTSAAYVSGTSGPWLTFGKAFSTMTSAGGHTTFVAPGTYRITAAIASSVTYAATTYIKGDPNRIQSWATQVNPGIVRLTTSDSNDLERASVDVISLTAVNNLEIWDIQIDGPRGNDSTRLVENSSYQSGTKLIRCVLLGSEEATLSVSGEDCVFISQNGANGGGGTYKRCFSIGLFQAFQEANCEQCIGISRDYNFYQTDTPALYTHKECLSMCGTYGFRSDTGATASKLHNCISVINSDMVRGHVSASIPRSCFLIFDYEDAYAPNAGDWSANRRLGALYSIQATGTGAAPAHFFQLPPARSIICNLVNAIKPLTFSDYAMSDSTTALTTGLDILGLSRTSRFSAEATSKAYAFPWNMSDVRPYYSASLGNTIRIYKVGQEFIEVPIKKSTNSTWSITCGYSMGGGTAYPGIELVDKNTLTSLSSDTIVSADSSPHSLSVSVVSASATADAIGMLIFKANETASGSYADFYGLTAT